MSAAGLLAHEVSEQFARQSTGISDIAQAHALGLAAERRVTGFQRAANKLEITSDRRLRVTIPLKSGQRSLKVTFIVANGNVVSVKRSP